MQRAKVVKQTEHKPVLLDAAMMALAIKPAGLYVDATYGRGGHSAAILQKLGESGRLLAFDKDPDACAHAWQTWGAEPRFHIQRASFACLGQTLSEQGLLGQVDGLLLDLGVSSPQLATAGRGFSFTRDGPLDMRMDPRSGRSAADWLATAGHGEIAHVLKHYGDESHAGRIASAIVKARETTPIARTRQLADLVAASVPRKLGAGTRIHPATKTFQAIRIHVNGELDDLSQVLRQSLTALAPGGRLAVISFHSLEDRMVKRFMREQARPEPPPLPMAEPAPATLRLIAKARHADAQELDENPRARSAVLRVAERTEAGVVS